MNKFKHACSYWLGPNIVAWIAFDLSDFSRFGLTTPKVWNDTVATLSLMALGSSAPEIFLAVVEIFKKKFHIGGLGTHILLGV